MSEIDKLEDTTTSNKVGLDVSESQMRGKSKEIDSLVRQKERVLRIESECIEMDIDDGGEDVAGVSRDEIETPQSKGKL